MRRSGADQGSGTRGTRETPTVIRDSAGRAIADNAKRVLLVGWFSFLHGEATAGDVLAWRAVCAELERAGIAHDTAWSPVFRPGGLILDAARPEDYSDLVFVCGPLHGPQIAGLHERFRCCRRIAVGVSVLDPRDPAVTGFDTIIARDAPDVTSRLDLATGPAASASEVPVIGVALAHGQGEYGPARRHESVTERITAWLREAGVAVVPLETRLDSVDWTLAARPEQLISVVRRLDAIVTTRLHGLVLGLANRVPVLAVDPVAGGGKVAAQAAAWRWPALLPAQQARNAALQESLDWCLSALGRERAGLLAQQAVAAAEAGSLAARIGARLS
ncbi:polysaccharide pyruvyl transferase family protein [Actinocrinis sp.]|uniref:polysaccharide pyruvyl transferase family protein n=1 Tax=Actinocrinis sp. TaxID=1920516 RepID=UPI002D513B2D|nr:polysaccharide pyruvyl transferase family protein [Actinocrinis sp.]HZP52712.1 polysaccharide pyruvyl transferase family protein [Actinocrinis sp.]